MPDVGQNCTSAIAPALPGDKIYTPDEAAGILAKTGIQPLDVYLGFPSKTYGSNVVVMMGGEATIASLWRSN